MTYSSGAPWGEYLFKVWLFCMSSKKSHLDAGLLRQKLIESSSNPDYVDILKGLSDDYLMDWHSLSLGFTGMSDMDSVIVRADILVERALRGLVKVVARNPLPNSTNIGQIKFFLRLMEPRDQVYVRAMSELNKARNIIAHEIYGDYKGNIKAMIKLLDLSDIAEPDAFGVKLATIVLISAISNRRGDLIQERAGYDEYRAQLKK
ncbi:hypothetical protein [Pseudomonas aeruginosa]|uniref:hypothetical protein n=1 Tax=Pseudomonas aeruginosa TaxID=287 RepID=UPI0015740639|nr:hypothetical protein [Pseudomonas aeruginosa]MCV4033833.1 hypothetical protein [Pseudomonas aeruginosa]NTT47221.1 hypothetical protein [Pseudomonas aeruginosa]